MKRGELYRVYRGSRHDPKDYRVFLVVSRHLDEYYTKNAPRLSGDGKSGFFAQHAAKGGHVIFVDDLSAEWLRIKAAADNTTPEAIIGELVREKVFAAAEA